jgi:hypothetical protein
VKLCPVRIATLAFAGLLLLAAASAGAESLAD